MLSKVSGVEEQESDEATASYKSAVFSFTHVKNIT